MDIVLANAVYFKGVWRHSFHPHGTWPGTFFCLDCSHAEASFMTAFGTMCIACFDAFKVLKLPYVPWRVVMFEEEELHCYEACYSMFVFLPDARDGITAMVDVVTAAPASLQGILDQMTERTVRVKLPKFEISFKWDDLEADLCRLGLSLPFSPEEADLQGMCVADDIAAEGDEQQRRPMSLSKVAHMAVVKVSEAGSEGVELDSYLRGRPDLTPDFVEFIADHPFTFLI
ncbi:putative serpin-Z5 [Panicum virgatum]|nr:putative serpin-Z5 [Panicum virgatum]